MKNLVGDKNSNAEIRRELERVGLKIIERTEPLSAEVAQSVTGDLPGFELHRNWCYWVVRGRVPLDVAEELYAHPVGRTDIRVEGHCGCPAPEAPWVEWFFDDGRQLIPRKSYDECVRMHERGFTSRASIERYVPDDAPEAASAKPYVTSYHIDSELGLYVFVETLRRRGVVT